MATDVSICTAALMLLGDSPIASLSENTKRAIMCNAIYSQARDEVLRAHPWNCLKTRVVLSPLADAPAFGWGYQFTKPGDFLRMIMAGDEEIGQTDYVFEGNVILADTDTLHVHYLARKGEGEWDAHLVQLMVRRMQMELAYPITKSASLRDSLKEDYFRQGTGILAQAKAVDGQENPPEDWGDSPLITVRG